MWKYLGHAVLERLRMPGEKHMSVVSEAERQLLSGSITGHEAAQTILNAIFK